MSCDTYYHKILGVLRHILLRHTLLRPILLRHLRHLLQRTAYSDSARHTCNVTHFARHTAADTTTTTRSTPQIALQDIDTHYITTHRHVPRRTHPYAVRHMDGTIPGLRSGLGLDLGEGCSTGRLGLGLGLVRVAAGDGTIPRQWSSKTHERRDPTAMESPMKHNNGVAHETQQWSRPCTTIQKHTRLKMTMRQQSNHPA